MAVIQTLCPACGFDLGFSPWLDDSPSDEICPCCGIQFGYDDAVGLRNRSLRGAVYAGWRNEWKQAGMPWRGKGRDAPKGWNPTDQLRRVE